MTVPIVSMDEAGQTGEHLLDAAQPVFTLASVDFSDDDAAGLIGQRSDELHFVKARGNRAGRLQVIKLLNALPRERVKVAAVHKPFMVTSKIVDQLVEPMMHDLGIDGYSDGSLLALANLWHLTCDAVVEPSFLPDLQRLFARAVRGRDRAALDAFYARLGDGLDRASLDVPAMREMWLFSREHFEALMEEQELPLLEPGVPTVQALVYDWARVHDAGFQVRHDQRNEIDRWVRHLSVYYGGHQPTREFTFRDGVTIRLPVPVTTFGTAASHQHPAIQIADVVASAAMHLLRRTVLAVDDDRFASELADTPVLDFIAPESMVWPNADLLESPPTPGPAGEFDRLHAWVRDAERPQ